MFVGGRILTMFVVTVSVAVKGSEVVLIYEKCVRSYVEKQLDSQM